MNLVEEFLTWEKKVEALGMALGIIGIDTTAVPPKQGRAFRNEHTAILAGEYFKLENDPEMVKYMENLLLTEGLLTKECKAAGMNLETDELADLRRRIELYYETASRQKAIPVEEFVAYQKVLEKSKAAWLQAKANDDWKSYAPIQKEVFEGAAKITGYQDSSLDIFDRMLDRHEKGMTQKEYDVFFNQVKERLVPIIRNNEAKKVELPKLWEQEYDIEKQRVFMNELLEYIGFTKEWGKMSESEHPLTSWISGGDVRFTTHYRLNNPVDSILSTIHESGHAWYAHNVDSKYDGTVIQSSISSGMHESQSRFCENHLGRSKAFWQKHYPRLQQLYPSELGSVNIDDFYKVVNESHPSLIRTQADELTYPLHILIRYELERDVFNGKLDPMDLEEAWKQKYKDYLGVEVKKASQGVLQDMHWSYGYFGYFPTYALGSAFAAQFDHYMRKEIDPDKLILENRYVEIMEWLKNRIQKYGNRYTASEVMQMATGESFNPKYYLDYLEEKYKLA